MSTKSILKKDQIYHKLLNSIQSGELVAGSKMLREVDLASTLEVGRITLRSALNRLDQEGFIKRIKGRGTFVSSSSSLNATSGMIMTIHGRNDDFSSPWLYIVPAITLQAHKYNLSVFDITKTAFETFTDNKIKKFIKEKNIVGIIANINSLNGDEPLLDKLAITNLPIVFAHAKIEDCEVTGFTTIAVDERSSWRTAINHLCQQGHTNIGIIVPGTPIFRGHTPKETLELLAVGGANDDPELIVRVQFDKDEIIQAVKTLLKVEPRPTALLCFSDFYAIYVYEALAMLNLKIPDDIAVMGLCGYPDADLLNPPLSTVDYKYEEFATMAVEMLLEPNRWSDPKTGQGRLRIKSFVLRARESTKLLTKEVNCNKFETQALPVYDNVSQM